MYTELDQNHIHVSCGIIESKGMVLAAQRSRWMRIPLKWEFPGGKIEDGELPENCLRRELMEELGIQVAIDHPLPPVTHDYPSLRVTLYPFVCRIVAGIPTNHEHEAIVWLPPEHLMTIDWTEADISIVLSYQKTLKREEGKTARGFQMKLLPYNIYFGQDDTDALKRISLQEFKEVAGETLTMMLGITNMAVKKYAIRREGEHEVLHLWCAYREDIALCTNCGSVTMKIHPKKTMSIRHSNVWGKQTFLHFISRRFKCEQCGCTYTEKLSL